MGIFKSKTKVTVATTVSRLIEDNRLPDSIKAGAIKGMVANGDLSEYAMEEMVGSIALRAQRMYNYAETKYTHGSPSGEIYSSNQGREEVQDVLWGIIGSIVALDYSRFGPPNLLHIGWMKLIELHGYVPDTNILGALSTAKGTSVYLKKVTVAVPAANLASYSAGALDQYGYSASSGFTLSTDYLTPAARLLTAHTLVYASPTAASEEIIVDYEWLAAGVINTGSFTVSVAGYDATRDYFHAKYSTASGTHYWMYQAGSGTYPSLDAVFEPVTVNGQFFPFAYFRFGKAPTNTNKTLPSYITSKKLVKYLGLDYDAVIASIHENPDIADVEQAMLIMAVPANSTNPVEQLYLYDFFDALYYAAPDQYQSQTMASIQAKQTADVIPGNAIVIQDKLFKMALNNSGIYKKRVAGQLGKIGTVTSGTITTYVTEQYSIGTGGEDSPFSKLTRSIPQTSHYYRKQISDVLYDEITVLNLTSVYHVYGNYAVTADELDDILLVPIDRSISRNYSMVKREVLYSRSLHMVFNSVVITKIKWYQTGFFKALLMIVAVVVAIYTINPEVLMMAIAVSAGTMTLAAFVWALAVMYLPTYLLMSVALKFFVKKVGTKVAIILAIVAAVVGAGMAINAGSLSRAPWAGELLSISSGLSKTATDVMGDALLGLIEEAKAYGLEMDAKFKLLEEKTDLLTENNILASTFIPGELPADFFQRTIHSGNIGIAGIDAVSSFVEIALTLPKLSDTSFGDTYA